MFLGSVVLIVVAVVVAGATVACATGRIPVNSFVGIRIRSVMMNEKTWRAGHRAALPAELIGAVVTVGIALTGFLSAPAAAPVLSIGATIALVGSTLIAAVFAHRAALVVLGNEVDA